MKVHIICEGETDKIIIEQILSIILKREIRSIEPSNTQLMNRGLHPILYNERIFFKFLHYSFSERVNCLIICIDNDEDRMNKHKFPIKRYKILESKLKKFINKNKKIYKTFQPQQIITIPVQTIDYWILAGLSKSSENPKIAYIERLPKTNIKQKVYGTENVTPMGIKKEAFRTKLGEAITLQNIEKKLIRLKNFEIFYNNIKTLG